LKPDKDKLLSFTDDLKGVVPPVVKEQESAEALFAFLHILEADIEIFRKEVEEL